MDALAEEMAEDRTHVATAVEVVVAAVTAAVMAMAMATRTMEMAMAAHPWRGTSEPAPPVPGRPQDASCGIEESVRVVLGCHTRLV